MDWRYAIITLILTGAILIYFRIAIRYSIIDKPNHRSSHNYLTIRGGGLVFPLAVLLYYLFFGKNEPASYTYLLSGMLGISLVSFWDDISSLPNILRISAHLICVSLLLYGVHFIPSAPVPLILLAYILIIGTINAYNFMDGINGMTGIYSLVLFGSFFYINEKVVYFADDNYIAAGIMACLVFLFFNFRSRAKCFAGDVGSVGLGYWISGLLLMLILKTGEIKFIFFLAVYGVDTVFTIIHRLFLRQNIFKAHRLHFYQILVNNCKLPHRLIALVYGLIQVAINMIIISTSWGPVTTALAVCLPLAIIYIAAKPYLMKWEPYLS